MQIDHNRRRRHNGVDHNRRRCRNRRPRLHRAWQHVSTFPRAQVLLHLLGQGDSCGFKLRSQILHLLGRDCCVDDGADPITHSEEEEGVRHRLYAKVRGGAATHDQGRVDYGAMAIHVKLFSPT